ncbi:40S ribosomal protein S3a-like [Vulpes lagopus]|uniref:40S ribosomal protein S3a-like n=1 Tax=Vulpes lagopus TaxID=494514 RepID=UPI001BC97F9C|nr:40S ribosomal protein S3a-like [Vulpes lagopus]
MSISTPQFLITISPGDLVLVYYIDDITLIESATGIRKTSYAQHQQVRQIRKKMMEIMTREVQTNDLKEVVNKLIPDSIGKDIEKACQSIYPLHDVFVRKVKMLKKPKFELGKLMELHGEGSSSGKATGDETGAKVERADGYEPPVQESV